MNRYLGVPVIMAGLVFSAFSAGKTNENFPASLRREVLNEVNRLRATGCRCGSRWMPPVPALSWSDRLERSAENHARDMKRHRFFSHTGSNGSTITQRIKREGFIMQGVRSYYVAENIAYGYPTIKRVVYEWKISEGHCHNLMNPRITHMGVAEVDRYWVQDLGYSAP